MLKKLTGKLRVFIIAAFLITSSTINGQTYWWDQKIPTTASASNELARGITMDGRGNSYVVGTYAGNVTFGSAATTSGGADIFISKLDRTGAYVWTVYGHGTGADDARGVAVYPDGAGGVNTYVTGFFTGTVSFTSTSGGPTVINTNSGGATNIDMYVVKYNDTGVLQWAMDCGSATVSAALPTIGQDLAVNNNGAGIDIWVTGSYVSTMSFGPSPYNAMPGNASNQNGFLACYVDGGTAPTGAAWAVTITGTQTCQGMAVDADQNGNAYITGYFLRDVTQTFSSTGGGGPFTINPYGGDDGFFSTYDGAGVLLNFDHWGNSNTAPSITSGTSGQGIAVGKNGAVYVTGSHVGNCTFPNATALNSYGGTQDGFLMGMDNATTTTNWLVQIGAGTGIDYGNSVVVDNCGLRCYVTGSFVGTASFGNGIVATSTVNSNGDAFLTDFDAPTGNAIAVTTAGSNTASTSIGNDVAVNSVEDIQFCGTFTASAFTFVPSGISVLANQGASDGFVARWDHSDWPALETTAKAINQGVDVVDCIDYAVGDMVGTNVQFGSLSTITSSQTNNASAYTSDVYLIATDKYANFTSFVRLTSGQSAETCTDVVTDGTYHYVSGSAVTGSNQTGVTFVGDATDSYTLTTSASNAIVIKSNLAGTVQWGTSIRANATSTVYGQAVAYDASGNVYFCGYYTGTPVVYNVGATTTGNAGALPTSAGSNDIFVVKYNSSGAVQWKKSFGGTGQDVALGISIDPSSSYYYITGYYSGTVTFANAHTSTGGTDGFLMRGNLSTGAAISDAVFGTATVGVNDKGNDIYSNGITEVYVTGQASATNNQVYVASYNMTNAAASNTWSFNSSGGGAYGYDILLGQNGYVYVSGLIGAATVSFGSLSAASVGAYVVSLASWNGTPTCISAIFTDSKYNNGLAQDIGDIANDHGFITLIGGTTNSNHAYLHKATEEGCEFSSRYGQGYAEENNSIASAGPGTSAVYPNPFNNSATLELGSTIDLTVSPVYLRIFDLTGRIVKQMDEITSQKTIISGEDFANGIYFYEIIQNGNVVSTGKMMINK